MEQTATRHALITALAPRVEGIVARAASRARDEIAVYATVSEAELREGIARDLGAGLAALIDDRVLSEAERAGMGLIGDTRARQGLPLESMLRVYRIAIDEVFTALWDASEEGLLGHQQVVALTRDVWRYADAAMEMAVAAYRERELEQAIADSQSSAALVHTLLLSPGAAPPGMLSSAGIDPDGTYVALRARAADEAGVRSVLLDLRVPGVLSGGMVAPYEGDVVGLGTGRPAIVIGPTQPVIIGVGPAGPLGSLPRSFAVATRVADTAAAFGRTGVFTIGDLAAEAIVRSEDALTDALIARYVTPVGPDTASGSELLDTVRALLTCGLSSEQAAERLDVHPNTVRNRLRRYEELTGASLHSVDTVVELRLALLRRELDVARSGAR